MLKNLTLYRFSATPPALGTLADSLQALPFIPCAPTQPVAMGWIPPRGNDGGPLVEAVGGHWLLKFMTEERVVPSAVIKRQAEAEADKIEQETGRRPKGKRMREIREAVVHALLPQAFTRRAETAVWLDLDAGTVAVDTASGKKADAIITALVSAAPDLKLSRVNAQQAPASCMTGWLSEQEAPNGFSIDRDCELKAPDGEKATVRYAHHTLDIDEVAEHIKQGKLPTRLAMTWNGRVSFVLTEAMTLKSINLLDVALENGREADADAFDADAAIFCGEARALIAELVAALGGYADWVQA